VYRTEALNFSTSLLYCAHTYSHSRIIILPHTHHTIKRSSTEVSASAFAYVYSELVQYHQNRVDSISELERRLESSGYGVGLKVLELLAYRTREVRYFKHYYLFLILLSIVGYAHLFFKVCFSQNVVPCFENHLQTTTHKKNISASL